MKKSPQQPPESPPAVVGSTLTGVMRRLKMAPASAEELLARKRQLVADFCRLLGEQFTGKRAAPPENPARPAEDPAAGLAPRVAQTLGRLLAGDSEKEIARHLGVSPHTVHVYVKAIHRHFNVSSRGELLARFVNRPQQSLVQSSSGEPSRAALLK